LNESISELDVMPVSNRSYHLASVEQPASLAHDDEINAPLDDGLPYDQPGRLAAVVGSFLRTMNEL
jgi:hypothetical protein